MAINSEAQNVVNVCEFNCFLTAVPEVLGGSLYCAAARRVTNVDGVRGA